MRYKVNDIIEWSLLHDWENHLVTSRVTTTYTCQTKVGIDHGGEFVIVYDAEIKNHYTKETHPERYL